MASVDADSVITSPLARASDLQAPSSSQATSSPASSSKLSLADADGENATITAKPIPPPPPKPVIKLKQKSQEDLRLLAISTHMTELSYQISDIQTRIFEIQELRHKSQSSSGDTAGTTAIIDQSLMNLDERLESLSAGMKTVSDSLEPLMQSTATPTVSQTGESNENAMILRKHATLVADWEAVHEESDVLREELKEDKWLTVFRTVTDQADGMMSSLEKGVNRCQEFIWQVHRHTENPHGTHSSRIDKPPPTFETFTSLLESFEAKKKHYMPATSKVLSIIDKGVRDRVTKNGETLRRHAESAQRWRNLRERISRTESDMETVRRLLLGDSLSDNGSSTSRTGNNGLLATPSRGSRTPNSASTISRSISPFRKLASKFKRSPASPVTPLNVAKNSGSRVVPSSEPIPRKPKSSLFTTIRSGSQTPTTPDRYGHKYSQSLTPDTSSPKDATVKARPSISTSNKQRWNSSTKVEVEDRTVKGTPPKRAPSATGYFGDVSSISNGSLFRRSLSRASMASSRPWSPLTSSVSTTASTNYPPATMYRPPSRAKTPSQAQTPSRGYTPGPTTPRPRPETPSLIPIPSKTSPSSEANFMDTDPSLTRAFSPAFSTSGMSAASTHFGHPPRPPSRSMIPVPTVRLSSPSRPGSSFSNYERAESPSTPFRTQAARAQTPESAMRARVQQMPIYHGSLASRTPASRPSIMGKLPPSSFKDGNGRTPSRPGSRNGAYTPSTDNPLHEYIPGNNKDPLDVEVAAIVNSISHGLLVERVDPPLKLIPKEGQEIKAQYSFSNALSKKIVTCRLTTLTRSGKAAGADTTTKKVMCRVGGGWQDLSHYILNRQSGM